MHPVERKRGESGFTIVEILVVIAIISMLAGLLMSGVMIAKKVALKRQTQVTLAGIGMALENYRTDVGDFPAGSGDFTSAETLHTELCTAKGFGPYFKASKGKQVRDTNGNGMMEIVDAWGNPILYTRGELLTDEREFELRSTGPDGIMETDDDIIM